MGILALNECSIIVVISCNTLEPKVLYNYRALFNIFFATVYLLVYGRTEKMYFTKQ